MICVVQRVIDARVEVLDKIVGKIGPGMLVLAAVERGDTSADVEWIAGKLVSMRIFRAVDKHFDIDVSQAGGSILLVSNFTVAAMTRKGRRPSFDQAAEPAQAQNIFDELVRAVRASGVEVQAGEFGADMKVTSTNDGPATFIVQTDQKAGVGSSSPAIL